MADRNNHYERAFEGYLRSQRTPCIPIDESRRACSADRTLKSLDFIVALEGGRPLLVDVKGRRLTGPNAGPENWATEDDLDSMACWRRAFDSSAALLAFVYLLPADAQRARFVDSFTDAGRSYGCLAIELDTFCAAMRVRSPKWRTFSVPRDRFRELARPLSAWLERKAG